MSLGLQDMPLGKLLFARVHESELQAIIERTAATVAIAEASWTRPISRAWHCQPGNKAWTVDTGAMQAHAKDVAASRYAGAKPSFCLEQSTSTWQVALPSKWSCRDLSGVGSQSDGQLQLPVSHRHGVCVQL